MSRQDSEYPSYEENPKHKPLHRAVYNDDMNKIQDLIKSGENINELSIYKTPLHIAVNKGSAKLVKVLLQAGADMNVLDEKEEKIPLHHAIKQENLQIIQLLLHHGARLDMKDGNGKTPHDIAIYKNNNKIIQLLERNAKT